MLNFVAGKQLRPVIDQQFTLDRARDALLSLESNHGMGKIVVTLD
ncbi:zinc-binding dehydrogenase [Steroidobacter cummioxidans]|nr:zinc-binding dehydrogenase [Steroidobacter cummioxidans]